MGGFDSFCGEFLTESFSGRFFSAYEDTREERRMSKAKLRENGRLEAIKRGKTVNENGKVIGTYSKEQNC